jgi:hypothetical protein
MAGEIVTKSKRFYCVSIVPDFCRTPIGASAIPVPYMIIGEFCEATGVSPNITSNGDPVVIHASTVIPTVKGDEPGIAKGIKSNTVGGRVQHMEKSSTLSFNGERAVRVGDLVYMNDKNTIGKVFERLDASTAFPEACEPGGTLAALKTAAKSRNIIPQVLLNFVPGGPLISAALNAAAGAANSLQSSTAAAFTGQSAGDSAVGILTSNSAAAITTYLTIAGGGGVSRGRGKDSGNEFAESVAANRARLRSPAPASQTQYAVVPRPFTQARENSFEQRVARTNVDAAKMFVEPAAQIGAGAAQIRDGERLAGTAQIGIGVLGVAPIGKFTLLNPFRSAKAIEGGGPSGYPRLSFPKTPDELTNLLGTQPKKAGVTPDGTQRTMWEPNSNTRIRFESHPDGLKPGDSGFNPRHHGEHFHVDLKPDGVSWNKAKKDGLIKKIMPVGYKPGTGKGFLPGEEFPGYN